MAGISTAVLLGLAVFSLASADPITFNFTGTATQVPIDDLGTGIQSGDAITGAFTFDSNAPDLVPAPSTGSYLSTGPAFGMTATIGGITFSESGQLDIGILNSFVDQYAVTASSALLTIEFLLQDSSGSIFASDALPLSPPLLAAFGQRDFHFDQTDAFGNETQVDGRITDLTCGSCNVSAVPEPSSLVLLFTIALPLGVWMARRKKAAQWMTGLLLLSALAYPVYAVDGVILINQNAALAGIPATDDAPGFPVTIEIPGSYRLSSNLIVPDRDTTAIQILTSNVTIDLNGFSITGPVECTGFPVTSCGPIANGAGISALIDRNNISIFNGTIQAMGAGINLNGGTHILIEKIHAVNNHGDGILLPGTIDAKVLSCTASENGGMGIAGGGGVISGNTANGNGSDGINANGSITNNVVESNGGSGIHGFGVISGNYAQANAHQGIFASCPFATVVSNTANGNTGGDIFTSGSGCTRANNTPAP